jgi:hypothetical protein
MTEVTGVTSDGHATAAAVTVAVTIGVDVGQKHDPSAIAVMESQRRAVEGGGGEPTGGAERWEEHHLARHLERLPLGTPYPQVAERLAAIVNNARDRARAEAAAAVGAAPLARSRCSWTPRAWASPWSTS